MEFGDHMTVATKIGATAQIVLTIIVAILLVNVILRIVGVPLLYSLSGSAVVTLGLFLYLYLDERTHARAVKRSRSA